MTSMTWSTELIHLSHIRQFLPPTVEVSNAVGGELRRKQGPFGSLGIFQDLDAPSGDPGRDHVQSLSSHIEGTHKDLVQ